MLHYLNTPISEIQLYSVHNQITYILLFCWIVICFLGFYIKSKKSKYIVTVFLISISVIQELFDYINRFFINDLYFVKIQIDLPLQLCHFAYWFSVICLLIQIYNNESKYKQFYFNCAYFLGFSGALQGILTVDLTDIYTFSDILALHLQHSLIILNLLWIIFAYKMQYNLKGLIQAFVFTNILICIVGPINYLLDSNYIFLCVPPAVNNPFIIGEWPYYLIILEFIFFIYGYILYLPFKLLNTIVRKRN